jgi:toxin ParE1/3/4
MRYAVHWANSAVEDLTQIRNWSAATRSGAEAERTINHLVRSALALADLPNRGKPGRVPGTRELFIPPFIIAYRVSREAVEILRVLHGARNWPTSI